MEQSNNFSQPTPPQESNFNQKPSAPKQRGVAKGAMVLVIAVVMATVGALGGYSFANSNSQEEINKLKVQIAAHEVTTHELPEGAIKVSECIPNMGAHYMPKGADPQYGPFLLVSKANKVIGMEYMVSDDMYTAIPGIEPPVEILPKESSLSGWKFDHLEFSRAPEGHEGFLEDHIDLHLYTVTPEQKKQACL
jgi:hypothetical protein